MRSTIVHPPASVDRPIDLRPIETVALRNKPIFKSRSIVDSAMVIISSFLTPCAPLHISLNRPRFRTKDMQYFKVLPTFERLIRRAAL